MPFCTKQQCRSTEGIENKLIMISKTKSTTKIPLFTHHTSNPDNLFSWFVFPANQRLGQISNRSARIFYKFLLSVTGHISWQFTACELAPMKKKTNLWNGKQATGIFLQHFGGVLDGWVEVTEKKLALCKVQQERYLHPVQPQKLLVSRLLPVFRIETCQITLPFELNRV